MSGLFKTYYYRGTILVVHTTDGQTRRSYCKSCKKLPGRLTPEKCNKERVVWLELGSERSGGFWECLEHQKSTILNGKNLQGSSSIIKSGDKITFLYSSAGFFFYESPYHVPSNFKKRKTTESEIDRSSIPCKILKTNSKDEGKSGFSQECHSGKPESDVLTPEDLNRDMKEKELDFIANEMKKFKELYEKTLDEFEKVKAANSSLAEDFAKELEKNNDAVEQLRQDVQTKKQEMTILKKEKEILLEKLTEEKETNEKMILEIQSLTETLKDCEEEKIRLAEERIYQANPVDSKFQTKEPQKSSTKDEDYFSASAFEKIVDLVEAKWNEGELEQLKSDLKKKDDRITDLMLEREKNRQELLETIDKELLCSICSEVLFNSVTLNCMHTFCKACLTEWKNKKKECPVCRTKIKLEIHPLVVDSFIERVCDFIGGDLRSRRDEVKAERNKLPSFSAEGSSGSRWRGSRRNRPVTPRRRRITAAVGVNSRFGTFPNPAVVIDLRDLPPIFPGGIIDLTGEPSHSRRSTRLHHNNNNQDY